LKKLLVILVLLSAVSINSKTIWKERNIYSAAGSVNVGDILQIHVADASKMRFNVTVKSKKFENLASNPDVTITGFLPKVKADRTSDINDTVTIDSRNQLDFTIAARITGNVNGNFAVTGNREYVINGISTLMSVSGQVSPSALSGRTVNSEDVLNFRLNIAGSKQGLGLNLTRPAVVAGKNADSTLTEDEKQKIITDYLTKMVEELTRK
jgi:flagellar basal body L-ring protein FlgH